MEQIVQNIREEAKKLLAEGKVEAVYGYAEPSLPMACRPFVARTPEEADKLWWDHFCTVNLANLIPRRSGKKIAVVAQGCVSRNLAVHHQENQIDLENEVIILGVPSPGMLDADKIRQAVGSTEITEVKVEAGKVHVKGVDFEDAELDQQEMKRHSCATCIHPNPVKVDIEIMPPVKEMERDKNNRVDQIEALAPAERQAWFEETFSRCIRCYACRNACPLCYCELCFVDEWKPQWLGKSTDMSETLVFHFLRAFHCAGRCTDCGACESACPVGIPVRVLTRKLEKDIQAAYGYEAGLDLEAKPPLNVYTPDDPNDFIM